MYITLLKQSVKFGIIPAILMVSEELFQRWMLVKNAMTDDWREPNRLNLYMLGHFALFSFLQLKEKNLPGIPCQIIYMYIQIVSSG